MHNSMDRPIPSLVSDAPMDSGKLPFLLVAMGPLPMLFIMPDCMTHHSTSIQGCNILKIFIAKILY